MTESGDPPPALARGWSGPPPPGAVPPAPGYLGPTPPPSAGPVAGHAAPGGRQPTRAAYDLEAGVVDVRPLRFTDILDGSFSLFRATLRVAAALVLVVMVPLQLLSAYLQREALSFGLTGILDDPAASEVLMGQGGLSPALLLTAATQVLVTPVLAGALVLVVGRRYLGQPVEVRQIVRETGRKAGWLILAYLVSGILRVLPLILVAASVATGSDIALGISVFLTGVVALVLTPLFVLVTPAIMLEQRRPLQAFLHAVTLVRNAYWRTVGVVVGTSMVFNLLALLLAGLPNVAGVIGGFGFAWVLIAAGSVLAQLIVAPLTAAAMVLLHADLRVRQEGLDFDIILQRMRPRAATT